MPIMRSRVKFPLGYGFLPRQSSVNFLYDRFVLDWHAIGIPYKEYELDSLFRVQPYIDLLYIFDTLQINSILITLKVHAM